MKETLATLKYWRGQAETSLRLTEDAHAEMVQTTITTGTQMSMLLEHENHMVNLRKYVKALTSAITVIEAAGAVVEDATFDSECTFRFCVVGEKEMKALISAIKEGE